MLEKMDAFFEARLAGYDDHMLTEIEGAAEFYPFTAECLPSWNGAAVLDLGCGTGLELEYYFARNPGARVTGVDLSAGMLNALREKFRDKALTLILGSYFKEDLGCERFDAAVSVESLHHFTLEEKRSLYTRLHTALKEDGYFILTDYFAHEDAFEEFCRTELNRLKAEQGISDNEFYHYDTPLTLEHEGEALRAAGFSRVEDLRSWGATHTIIAVK